MTNRRLFMLNRNPIILFNPPEVTFPDCYVMCRKNTCLLFGSAPAEADTLDITTLDDGEEKNADEDENSNTHT